MHYILRKALRYNYLLQVRNKETRVGVVKGVLMSLVNIACSVVMPASQPGKCLH